MTLSPEHDAQEANPSWDAPQVTLISKDRLPDSVPSGARHGSSGGNRGGSIEATLETVGMSRYGEYGLFDWAHGTVNVPAAYNALLQPAR